MSSADRDSALGYPILSAQSVPIRSPVELGDGSQTVERRWDGLVAEFEVWLDEKDAQRLVFVEKVTGELLVVPASHRFQHDYTRMQRAKMGSFERGMREEFDDPTLYLVSPTVSTTRLGAPYPPTTVDHLRPPIDVFDELKEGWRSLYRKLRYELRDVEHEYLWIFEPTTDDGGVPGGYPNFHIAIVTDGPLQRQRLERIVDHWVDSCPNAGASANSYEQTIKGGTFTDDNIGAYLFKYLGKSWNREEITGYERRFNALLWETGYRRFQPSDGAQRWMKLTDDESDDREWSFSGVCDASTAAELSEFDDHTEFRIEHQVSVGMFIAGQTDPIGSQSPEERKWFEIANDLSELRLSVFDSFPQWRGGLFDQSTKDHVDASIDFATVEGQRTPVLDPGFVSWMIEYTPHLASEIVVGETTATAAP